MQKENKNSGSCTDKCTFTLSCRFVALPSLVQLLCREVDGHGHSVSRDFSFISFCFCRPKVWRRLTFAFSTNFKRSLCCGRIGRRLIPPNYSIPGNRAVPQYKCKEVCFVALFGGISSPMVHSIQKSPFQLVLCRLTSWPSLLIWPLCMFVCLFVCLIFES